MTWDIAAAGKGDKENVTLFLDNGYEPFAVDDGVIYFKRLTPADDE